MKILWMKPCIATGPRHDKEVFFPVVLNYYVPRSGWTPCTPLPWAPEGTRKRGIHEETWRERERNASNGLSCWDEKVTRLSGTKIDAQNWFCCPGKGKWRRRRRQLLWKLVPRTFPFSLGIEGRGPGERNLSWWGWWRQGWWWWRWRLLRWSNMLMKCGKRTSCLRWKAPLTCANLTSSSFSRSLLSIFSSSFPRSFSKCSFFVFSWSLLRISDSSSSCKFYNTWLFNLGQNVTMKRSDRRMSTKLYWPISFL